MSSTFKNISYQTIYQILSICVPLITSPYISRVLEPEGLGTYSYSYSIVTYFILFAMLGTSTYGCREIAIINEKKGNLGKTFSEIYTVQFLSSILMITLYYAFALKLNLNLIFFIQGIWIFSTLCDVSWFFFGIQDFRTTVIRNMAVKFLTTISIFIFINTKDDLWKYCLILSVGSFLSQVILWPFLKKYISFYIPKLDNVKKHFYKNIYMFLPLLGNAVYTTMDKTMLGFISSAQESGYYYNADKVMSIPATVILAIGTVMLPKMSSMRVSGYKQNEEKVLNLSLEMILFITIGMAMIVVSVCEEFVPFFFGKGYDKCVGLIYIFSFIIIVKVLSNTLKYQYFLPRFKEGIYSVSIFLGAIVNIVANIYMIAVLGYGSYGATIGTLFAEATICIYLILQSYDDINFFKKTKNIIFYFVNSIIMICLVRVIAYILSDFNYLAKLIIETLVGITIYAGLCLAFWNHEKDSFSMYILNNIACIIERIRK